LHDDVPEDYRLAYGVHARTVAHDAYWKQVGRTVNGGPVPESQITLIVDAIAAGLSLELTDVVMPVDFYASCYRFDATPERSGS
jgi:hypothetical protein